MQPGAKWEEVKFMNTSAELWKWNTPIPYLYCGVGFICAAIAFAIFYRFQNRQNSIPELQEPEVVLEIDEEKNQMHDQICALDAEPKIVLVIVGHDKLPLYIGKTTYNTFSSNVSQQV
ncbi:hypothetical protein FXO37_25548 [Capsicum annuum]|nr:hypothetical protein FXO37_25548 [Capsicum annuum]